MKVEGKKKQPLSQISIPEIKNFQRLFSYGVASLELTNGRVTSVENFASEILGLCLYLSSLFVTIRQTGKGSLMIGASLEEVVS